MKWDLLAISGGLIAFGAVVWTFWGNPETVTRAQPVHQELAADPDLKLISERSPYMRTER
jgi:hypothetical protein